MHELSAVVPWVKPFGVQDAKAILIQNVQDTVASEVDRLDLERCDVESIQNDVVILVLVEDDQLD